MGNELKGALYRALKAEGVELPAPYKNLTVAMLQEAYDTLREAKPSLPETPPFDGTESPRSAPVPPTASGPTPARSSSPTTRNSPQHANVRRGPKDPTEMAGQRMNTQAEGEPLRIDEQGLVWYVEEISKPAFPKPRGRRVLTYLETGVKQVTSERDNAGYVETFEVAGDEQARTAEVKVTLPSFQVGKYKDPRYPFLIHVYNNNRGFDLHEVETYYGGAELVPKEVKRMYVENVLCYDMRTVVREIQSEFNRMQLAGKL